MSVNATQSAEPIAGNAHALEVRHLDATRIANHYVFDIPFAIDEYANLPACFMRKLAELAREFLSYDLMWRNASLIKLFDSPKLVWFQTLSVAVKTSHAVDCRNYNMIEFATKLLCNCI